MTGPGMRLAWCSPAGPRTSSWTRRCRPSRRGGTGCSSGRRPTAWTRGRCWRPWPPAPPASGSAPCSPPCPGGARGRWPARWRRWTSCPAAGRSSPSASAPSPPISPTPARLTDIRARAERLDDGIDLMRALWAGSRATTGSTTTTRPAVGSRRGRAARPAADPAVGGRRVAAAEVHAPGAALRRHHPAVRTDGREPGPDDARAVRDWLAAHGAGPGLDMVAEGETPADDPAAAAAKVAPWADAGCTWWLETRWEMPHDSPERMREISERIAAGPPPPGPHKVARPPPAPAGGLPAVELALPVQKVTSAVRHAGAATAARRRRAGRPRQPAQAHGGGPPGEPGHDVERTGQRQDHQGGADRIDRGHRVVVAGRRGGEVASRLAECHSARLIWGRCSRRYPRLKVSSGMTHSTQPVTMIRARRRSPVTRGSRGPLDTALFRMG